MYVYPAHRTQNVDFVIMLLFLYPHNSIDGDGMKTIS